MRTSIVFIAPTCTSANMMGSNCNVSKKPCDIAQPCQNGGLCTNTNDTDIGFFCACPNGFSGRDCEIDLRPCQSYSCWNGNEYRFDSLWMNQHRDILGQCKPLSQSSFECLCQPGWTGRYCETMINYCNGTVCLNNGVCRPLLLNYACECLGSSYTGRHCEFVSARIYIYRYTARSFASVAITSVILFVAFLIFMDLLKYGFRIDPVKRERRRWPRRRKKKTPKLPHRPHIQRFKYVNEFPTAMQVATEY